MFYAIYFFVFGFALSAPHDSLTDPGYFVHPNARNNAINLRIIGGEEASPHQFPYQVGIYCIKATSTEFCGGSLVSNNYILTAAHCIDEALSANVILGAHQITEEESSQVRQSSSDFTIHPDWNRTGLINDIAFIKLSEPVEENDYIQIVKIAGDTEELFAESEGTISGWGTITNGQSGVTPTLRFLVSQILSNEDCKAIDPYESVIQYTHLCLSGLANEENVGTCNGDSGGPLTVDGVQVGVVSFGYRDCDVGKPSVFTRLTEYLDWIRENSDVDV